MSQPSVRQFGIATPAAAVVVVKSSYTRSHDRQIASARASGRDTYNLRMARNLHCVYDKIDSESPYKVSETDRKNAKRSDYF